MDVISPLKIEKVVYGGNGLSREQNKVIFTPFTIKGEVIAAKILKSKKNFSQSEVLRIIESSPHRVKPRCSHFGVCGGCQFQHMDYKEQLRTKKEILIENIQAFIDPSKLEIIGIESQIWDYREHIKLTYQDGILGYHGNTDKNVFSVSMCPIFSEKLPSLLNQLKLALQEAETVYAEIRLLKSHDGFIAAIKFEGANYKALEKLASHFKGISIKTHHDRIDIGKCHIIQSYLGKDFHMDIWSFMQNHRTMAEKLYQYVIDSIPSNTQVLADLYCGCGLLSILASSKSIPHIYGIELNPASISCAKKSLEEFNLSNIEFIAAPAEQLFKHVKKPINFVIINPPREGLSELMLYKLTSIPEAHLCYISCNPTTLNRDLKIFKNEGFEVVEARGFDLFPHTTHLETVCIIKKR